MSPAPSRWLRVQLGRQPSSVVGVSIVMGVPQNFWFIKFINAYFMENAILRNGWNGWVGSSPISGYLHLPIFFHMMFECILIVSGSELRRIGCNWALGLVANICQSCADHYDMSHTTTKHSVDPDHRRFAFDSWNEGLEFHVGPCFFNLYLLNIVWWMVYHT